MKIINAMEKAGLITQKGENKGRRYLLSNASPKVNKIMNEYIQDLQSQFLN